MNRLWSSSTWIVLCIISLLWWVYVFYEGEHDRLNFLFHFLFLWNYLKSNTDVNGCQKLNWKFLNLLYSSIVFLSLPFFPRCANINTFHGSMRKMWWTVRERAIGSWFKGKLMYLGHMILTEANWYFSFSHWVAKFDCQWRNLDQQNLASCFFANTSFSFPSSIIEWRLFFCRIEKLFQH